MQYFFNNVFVGLFKYLVKYFLFYFSFISINKNLLIILKWNYFILLVYSK